MIDTILTRVWDQLVGRLSGPMSFRLLLQPLVAVTLGIRAGLRDARAHRPAYLWTVLTAAGGRRQLLLGGWRDVGRLFAIDAGLDSLYQIGLLRFFYSLQALAVACVLAIAPYVATRGRVTFNGEEDPPSGQTMSASWPSSVISDVRRPRPAIERPQQSSYLL